MSKTKIRELDKHANSIDDQRTIMDFIEFVSGKGIHFAEWDEGGYHMHQTFKSNQDLLYEFFKIDPKKLEKERRELLDKQRELNASMEM